MNDTTLNATFALLGMTALAGNLNAQTDTQELAKKLSNPVAALISVPFQLNIDHDIGPEDAGDRMTLNIQPVVPISLSENWNLISRTILPVVDQQDIFPGAGDQFGLGDVVQSVFFSPKAPTAGGWIWGAGPRNRVDRQQRDETVHHVRITSPATSVEGPVNLREHPTPGIDQKG
jgi:hypothetical protein